MSHKNSSKKVRSLPETYKSKGDLSRDTILTAAAKLATTKGLIGLSIGDLAAEVGMSKSGLYAHFKSKEELELATIAAAVDVLTREVLASAMALPPGLTRLRGLMGKFLDHLSRRVFPGGCFVAFVSTELSSRPGEARDHIVKVLEMWLGLLRQCLVDAQRLGEIRPDADHEQLVFEIESMSLGGNYFFIMTKDPTALTRAREGVEAVLARVMLPGAPQAEIAK